MFILDVIIDLKKMNRRVLQVITHHDFKHEHPAAETTHNIANYELQFGLEWPSERTVRYWFEQFSSEEFKLEDKPVPGQSM